MSTAHRCFDEAHYLDRFIPGRWPGLALQISLDLPDLAAGSPGSAALFGPDWESCGCKECGDVMIVMMVGVDAGRTVRPALAVITTESAKVEADRAGFLAFVRATAADFYRDAAAGRPELFPAIPCKDSQELLDRCFEARY